MNEQIVAARIGLRAALQLRRSLSIPRETPINVYDVAKAIGINVRFMDSPSLEGMFSRDPEPMVFLPSSKHRPSGRICFSCAHELGHQQLNHGTRVDEYVAGGHTGKRPVEEVTADVFAAQLLMPRPAVLSAFYRRKLTPDSASPLQLYCISREIGVGYETLLLHMEISLGLLSKSIADQHRRQTPKSIRADVLDADIAAGLSIVDSEWANVPVDVEVGDHVGMTGHPKELPPQVGFDKQIKTYHFLKAMRPGVGTFNIYGRPIVVRVSRKHYAGPFSNKYLDDPDFE